MCVIMAKDPTNSTLSVSDSFCLKEYKENCDNDKKSGAELESSTSSSSNYSPRESKRIIRNVVILSFSFTILFTSFSGMSRLQSSINTEDGLGVYSLSTIYGSIVIAAMFVPSFVIQRFTVKSTIAFSMLGYVTYIGAQFYPTFWTLIPSAVVVGICGAPLWAAKCSYITHIANRYAELVGESAAVVIPRFFGIFFFTFQTQGIWGNLISSTILSTGETTNTSRDISVCGSSFCPADARSYAIIKPSTTKIYTLAGIYFVVGIAAAGFVAIFLDSLTRYGEGTNGVKVKSAKEYIIATFSHLQNPIQILIIPLTLWSGLEQGFSGSDFYQAYVTCAWGVENLGWVGICYAVCDSLASILFGPILRWFGRIPILIFGALLNVGMIFLLFKWQPDPNSPIMFFVIAGVWGIADAVWQTQINALYGTLFINAEEAAFSNYRLWESTGFILAYMNSNLLCVDSKLYILLGVLALGMLGYFIIEIIERRRSSNIKL